MEQEQNHGDAEQGIQHESRHVSIDTTPQVHHYRDDSGSRSQRPCDVDDFDGMVYVSFNLQNINAPVPPKWKHNTISWRNTRNFVIPVRAYLMDLWPMLQVAKLKPIWFSFGVDLTVKTSTTISSLMMMKCMTLIM